MAERGELSEQWTCAGCGALAESPDDFATPRQEAQENGYWLRRPEYGWWLYERGRDEVYCCSESCAKAYDASLIGAESQS